MSVNKIATLGKVDSVDFAIYLNKKAGELRKSVNVTKIQKWLYICYGLYLAVYHEQLLTERPRAWQYGPAFPLVYKIQKKHGNSLDNLQNTLPSKEIEKYDKLIHATLINFGEWTASELVAWTHEKDKAWDRTIQLEGEYATMDNHDIFLDFQNLMCNKL